MNLDQIIFTGVILSFILPMIVVINQTLPPPTVNGLPNNNITLSLQNAGIYINTSITSVYKNVSSAVLPANKTGGVYAQVGIVSAFAFILQSIGAVVLTIVQIPYLDFLAMQVLIGGLSTVLPGIIVGVLEVGVSLLYLYMAFCMLMLGVSLIQKVDALNVGG